MSETLKAHSRRLEDNFYSYVKEPILDIGYAGTGGETFPNYNVVGLDLDTPGYDGKVLPYPDESFLTVYSSHLLEHVDYDILHIKEHFRCTKVGGHLIIYIPHQWLYEKKTNLPSNFNLDHKRFYTPATLLYSIEKALVDNTYRIRRLQDCDKDFDYNLSPQEHSVGEYSIECVIERLL